MKTANSLKNKYLIANPYGTFLIRCSTIKEAREFIRKHIEQCQDAWYLLTKTHLKMKDYQVRDLTEIPVLTKNNS